MIVRRGENEFLLIAQHDHALACGQLAARLGNSLFAPPSPYQQVVVAAAQHDCGWPGHEPTRDERGFPVDVLHCPIDVSVGAWSASVDRVVEQDPYAGLLVSLHVMALGARAGMPTSDAGDISPAARHVSFGLSRFLHRQIEIQESLRGRLGLRVDLPLRAGLAELGRSPEEDLLRTNFYLLQLLDQISLVFCFDRMVVKDRREIYPRTGVAALAVRIDRDGDGAVRVDPWPFDAAEIELPILGRRIAAKSYGSDEELKSAWSAAKVELLAARVRR